MSFWYRLDHAYPLILADIAYAEDVVLRRAHPAPADVPGSTVVLDPGDVIGLPAEVSHALLTPIENPDAAVPAPPVEPAAPVPPAEPAADTEQPASPPDAQPAPEATPEALS